MSKVQVEDLKPSLVYIPTEVCENIIDMLDSELIVDTLENIATLHSCSLVCRDWRVRSQKMLFYKVQLADTTSFHRLSTILDDRQHLRDYVHKVELTGYHLHNTTSIFATFPVVFARKLPNLFRIEVAHIPDTPETRFPRTLVSPKAKALPYIPLHPRFPAFLSAFKAVSALYLAETTFRTFSEFARMLNGLPNLEELACHSVRWIAPGGSHPGADFATQPEWVAGKDTLPPFAPKLRKLSLWNVAMYGAKRLIWTRGPHLTLLELTIPPSSDLEALVDDGKALAIDFGSCTGLKALELFFTSQFSMDTHGGCIAELLASWKPLRLDPVLKLSPASENGTTRRGFAEVLRGIGTIIEAWLQTLEDPTAAGEIQDHQQVKYELKVEIYEWESMGRWWMDHLESCFPTWVKLGRIDLILLTPQGTYDEWVNEVEPPQSGTVAVSQVEEFASSSLLKMTKPT
ncbi:hypothetical protein GSI_05103 [Ganoderma sinense ZZ0214-1]|uniref:F-box domain-containing protein n=1 Tax=Ganoderma sinense ZZ0214-1 TaxID=1077348 RepID=A0A2G8SGS1_9APHY|nr:hypothetical protein GSI_05103 [Ganoderma sinense ZZ0214-1]